jgi:hypothetical protein
MMQAMFVAMDTPERPMNFEDTLIDYMRNGWVRTSPTAMALAKPCRDKEGNYWFIYAAVGPLAELMSMLPSYLPRIAWARDNDGVVRKYRTERLLKIAVAQLKKDRG